VFSVQGSDRTLLSTGLLKPCVTVAQLVEHMAVNHSVSGSSPDCGVPIIGRNFGALAQITS
jgi:hypothetical protein